MRLRLFGIWILIAILLLQSSLAYMPTTHIVGIHEACKKGYTTNIAKACCQNEKACMAGAILDDISIIYYLEKGMKKYTVTHSNIFCEDALAKARTPDEEAFAAGMCAHHPYDIVAHNFLVPYAIRHTYLPNVLVHPFAEQKVDNYVRKQYPYADKLLNDALDEAENYVDFMERILQPNPEYEDIDVRRLTLAFIENVKGSHSGYDLSFNTLRAIPFYMYLIVLLFLTFNIMGIVYLIRNTSLGALQLITLAILLMFTILLIILLFGAFTGTLWSMFIGIAKPLSEFVPIPSITQQLDTANQYMEYLFVYGSDYINHIPLEWRDATGIGTSTNPGQIRLAEQDTFIPRLVVGIVLLLGILLLFYKSFKYK